MVIWIVNKASTKRINFFLMPLMRWRMHKRYSQSACNVTLIHVINEHEGQDCIYILGYSWD